MSMDITIVIVAVTMGIALGTYGYGASASGGGGQGECQVINVMMNRSSVGGLNLSWCVTLQLKKTMCP